MAKSYANATSSDVFPSKDQAIVIESKDTLTIREYVDEIAKIIGPKNIKFVSRISNNRICLFLANKQLVDDLVLTTVSINGFQLPIRPLITHHKRLIISNVCPVIPHVVIENELHKLQIRTVSKLSFLKAGMSKLDFIHIMSFRRQIFIDPMDLHKVPKSLHIHYDSTSYWIYFSSDNITCFICKKEGHVARQCSQIESNPKGTLTHSHQGDGEVSLDYTDDIRSVTIDKTLDSISLEDSNTVDSDSQITNIYKDAFPSLPAPKAPPIVQKPVKRPMSTSSLDSDNCSPPTISIVDNAQDQNPSRKKVKKISLNNENLEEQLQPLKGTLSSENNPFVLNYVQLLNFLDRSKGHSYVKDLALEYTSNTDRLVSMLRENYNLLCNRKIKNKFTRIIKKLLTSGNLESDVATETSEDENNINAPKI